METIQQNRTVYHRTRLPKGCRGNCTAKTGLRSGRIAADDFLRTHFQPIVTDPSILENWQGTEQHFISTLRHVEKKYNLEKTAVTDQPFPLNVFETFERVREQFDRKHYSEKLFLIQNGSYPYCLATAKPMDTGCTLYHMPFDLIVKLGRSKKHKYLCRLILCAYAYLYQIAGIPSYSKSDFMSGCYEMLREWIEGNGEDWEPNALRKAKSELNAAKYYKDKMHRILSHPRHLSDWERILTIYGRNGNPKDPAVELSSKFYDLYRKYPNRTIYDQRLGESWALEDDNLMEMDQYISFVWSNDGWIGEEAGTYINDNSGNYDWIDEPLIFTIYDEPSGRSGNDLEFEKCLLAYIDQLVGLLNELNHDKN